MDRRSLGVVLAVWLSLVGHQRAAWADGLTIDAAASLSEVMRDVGVAWQRAGHALPHVNLAASSTLARQIDQGAKANLFASADEKWMDWVQQRNLIVAETRLDILSNSLVLVVPKDRARHVTLGPNFDLAALLGPSGRLAVGDPANVPAGIYAKQSLQKLGVWNVAGPRLASSDSVRSALLLVERGEAPAGIVYATDAAVAPGVVVAGTFPEDSHDKITYPFVVVKAGDTSEARAFMAFLTGDVARGLFRARGFSAQ